MKILSLMHSLFSHCSMFADFGSIQLCKYYLNPFVKLQIQNASKLLQACVRVSKHPETIRGSSSKLKFAGGFEKSMRCYNYKKHQETQKCSNMATVATTIMLTLLQIANVKQSDDYLGHIGPFGSCKLPTWL